MVEWSTKWRENTAHRCMADLLDAVTHGEIGRAFCICYDKDGNPRETLLESALGVPWVAAMAGAGSRAAAGRGVVTAQTGEGKLHAGHEPSPAHLLKAEAEATAGRSQLKMPAQPAQTGAAKHAWVGRGSGGRGGGCAGRGKQVPVDASPQPSASLSPPFPPKTRAPKLPPHVSTAPPTTAGPSRRTIGEQIGCAERQGKASQYLVPSTRCVCVGGVYPRVGLPSSHYPEKSVWAPGAACRWA